MKTPWGRMWTLLKGKRFWFKVLWIKGCTSYQSHKERDEWHLSFCKVKRGQKHRLSRGLHFEFIRGSPKEEDIIRHEDDYGR